MSPEAAYLEAALPETVTLLGQRLEPYSLGHEMILQRHQSPLLNPSRPVLLMDLMLAVFICCQRYDEALASLHDRGLQKKLKRWQRKLRTVDEPAKVEAFRSYVRKGSTCPPFEFRKRSGWEHRTSGSAWYALLLNTLMGELNWSRPDALNCGYGWAQWLYHTHWERQGSIAITLRRDAKMDELRAMIAKEGLQFMKVRREDQEVVRLENKGR